MSIGIRKLTIAFARLCLHHHFAIGSEFYIFLFYVGKKGEVSKEYRESFLDADQALTTSGVARS